MDKKLMIKSKVISIRIHARIPLLLLPLCVVFLMFISDVAMSVPIDDGIGRPKDFDIGEIAWPIDDDIDIDEPKPCSDLLPDIYIDVLLRYEGFPFVGSEVQIKAEDPKIKIVSPSPINPYACTTIEYPLEELPHFHWDLIAPDGSDSELSGESTLTPSLVLDVVGKYKVKFTICPDECAVPKPTGGEYTAKPFTKYLTISAVDILIPETEPLDPLQVPTLQTPTLPTELGDECGLYPGFSCPQWVTVNEWHGPENYELLEGRVWGAHISRMDNPINHQSQDFLIFVRPDPKYRRLLDPSDAIKNEIEVEWEIGAERDIFPEKFWPSRGDRVSVVGYWVNDCGHGPKAEIHPPVMVATHRARPIQIPYDWVDEKGDRYGDNIYVPGIVTHVWINQDGGEATSDCKMTGLHHRPEGLEPVPSGCYPLEECIPCIPRSEDFDYNPINRIFEFNIYLPRSPQVAMEEIGIRTPPVPLYWHGSFFPGYEGPPGSLDIHDEMKDGVTYLKVKLDLTSFTGDKCALKIESGWIYPHPDNWGLVRRKLRINYIDVLNDSDLGSDGEWWFWFNINNGHQEWTNLWSHESVDESEHHFDPPWETDSIYPYRNLGPDILLFPFNSKMIRVHTSGYEHDDVVADSTGDTNRFYLPSELGWHGLLSTCESALPFWAVFPEGFPLEAIIEDLSDCGLYTIQFDIIEGAPVGGAVLGPAGQEIYDAYKVGPIDPFTLEQLPTMVLPDLTSEFSNPQGTRGEPIESILLFDILPGKFSEIVASLRQTNPDLLDGLMKELRREVDLALSSPLSKGLTVNLATVRREVPSDLWDEYFGDFAVPAVLTLTYNQLDSSGFPQITSFVTVSDENDAPITGLTTEYFMVEEDGATQNITVTPVDKKASAVSVALVIDCSDSMRVLDRLVNAKAAASDFVDQIGSSDKAAVISFGNDVTVNQDFISDKSRLKLAINNLIAEGISFTAIYDALLTAADRIRGQSGLKTIILLSDGGVDEESPGIDKAIDKVNQLGIAIYTIGLDIVLEGEGQALQRIAQETGGQYFSATKSKELPQIYQRISQQLQNQYQITYTTSDTVCNTTRKVSIVAFYYQIDINQKSYSSPSCRLIIPELTASPGDTITVPIDVADAIGVAGADMVVTYDKDVLTINEAKTTTLSTGMSLSTNTETAGEIILSIAGAEGITKGSGPLLDVVFTVSESAEIGEETALTFKEAILYDKLGQTIPTGTQSGKITIIPVCVKGDLNDDGKIRANDAIIALRIAVGLMEPTTQQECAADMNDDGKVRANDAILILRKAVGLTAPSIQPTATIGKEIIVTLSEAHGVAGESITAPLKVDNVHELAGGDIGIGYDRTVLRTVDVSSDSDVLLASKIDESGMIHIAFASADKLNGQTIAEIRFDILANDVSPLTIENVELYRTDALPVDSQKVNGSFSSWAIPPEHSALLQNFPNPFNPETWIPYQLAKGGDIMIRIYNVKGELVKTLELGYQPAGIYTHRSRAAYWDGLNSAGEKAASGIYFYQIKAGDFSAMRKMVIVK